MMKLQTIGIELTPMYLHYIGVNSIKTDLQIRNYLNIVPTLLE